SETTVANMVDTFLFLTLARTGDQLQGIKKGVLELADVIAVNKADGAHEIEAKRAARELAGALRLLRGAGDDGWQTPVLTCSAMTGVGLTDVWAQVTHHQDALDARGELAAKRRRQQVDWTWAMVHDRLLGDLHGALAVKAAVPDLERRVRDGTLTPALAADEILAAYRS
nr:methylmalonyl Co-A mutase-associated GTPase MeaB [Micromonospora sp. DSM 115978]